MSGTLNGVAELTVASPAAKCRGHVDIVSDLMISGWVFNPSRTEQRVGVAVNGVPMSTLSAAEYRADVQQAGFGDGRAGFAVMLPADTFREGGFLLEIYEAETRELLVDGVFTLWDGRKQSISPADLEKLTLSQFFDCYYNIRGTNEVGAVSTQISRMVKGLLPIEALSVIYFLVLKRSPDPDAIDRLKRMPQKSHAYGKLAKSLIESDEFQQRHELRSLRERLESFTLPSFRRT